MSNVVMKATDETELRALLGAMTDPPALAAAAQELIAEARRSLELAALFADKAARLSPTDPIPPLVLGGIHLSLGDPDAARRCYDRILEFAPDQTDTLYTLGVLYHRAGLFERAADCFKKVIAARPTDIDPYYKLHSELVFLGRIPELIEILDRALGAHPTLQLADRPADFHARQDDAIAAGLPAIFLNTMAKSGSVYIYQRLMHALGLPFSRIAVGTMMRERVVPSWAAQVARGGALTLHHLDATPENLAALYASGLRQVAVHVRDPRQAMVSLAHHFTLGYREQEMHWQKHSMSPYCPAFDTWPFEQQLRWTIDHYYQRYVQWVADWARAADDMSCGIDVLLLTFEEFRSDEPEYFQRLLRFVGVDPARLLAQPSVSRKTGEFHYRKGMVDEWRSVCAPDQREWMCATLPETLMRRFRWAQ